MKQIDIKDNKIKKILVLGDGLLGSEFVKQTNWDYISRKKDNFDLDVLMEETGFNPITENISYILDKISEYDIIINCIAYTNTRDNTPEKHDKINHRFALELAEACYISKKKLVHISSDYLYCYSSKPSNEDSALFPPHNWYGYSKMSADYGIENYGKKLEYLILRASFKSNPYPYEYAWTDLIGNFDYVDRIAKIMIDLIKDNAKGIYNVGTNVKTLYELAYETKKNVIGNTKSYGDRPHDITMNLNKLTEFYKKFINKENNKI